MEEKREVKKMKAPINFQDSAREISCRTINTIIKYVRYKGEDVGPLIAGLPFDEKYFTDTNNWISCELAEEIYRRLKTMFDDDEIMYKVPYPNHCFVERQILTRPSIKGTSMSTPTTVASAAPELRPKSIVATAIATSKWLLAPICEVGAASSYLSFNFQDIP